MRQSRDSAGRSPRLTTEGTSPQRRDVAMAVIDNAGLVVDRKREMRRVIFSSYLGSAVEFYDFLLYGTAAALVFPTVFFSGLDPFTAVIFSFAHLRRRLPRAPAGWGDLRPLR